MTYARQYPYETIPWIEQHDIPVLTNAVHRWSEAKGAFLNMWEYDTLHTLDSGGYNVQAAFVNPDGTPKDEYSTEDIEAELEKNAPFYPWTVREYHEWLQEHADEVEWAAPMDYACEERFDTMWSAEDRVEATIENTIKQHKMDRDYDLLPVLQGRTVDEYVECARRFQSAGIDISKVGLGTVCRMSSSQEIVRVEHEIRERVDEIDHIHGFGVKVNAYKLGASFDSADSAAWVDRPMHGKSYVLKVDGDGYMLQDVPMRSDNRGATEHSFIAYYAYVSWLKEGEAGVPIEAVFERQKELDVCDVRPDDSHLHS